MFPPVLKSVCLARGYGNRIHIKMIKRNSEIYERERERDNVLTDTGIHQHGSNSYCTRVSTQLFTSSWF